jgi:hypothetical protein
MLVLGASVPAAGQDVQVLLALGDDAPVLDAAAWIRGEPIAGFEPGRVYVLDFWTTQDDQSRAVLAALSNLQDRFQDRGVTVVGITHEEPSVVAEFVGAADGRDAAQGERGRCALAADPDGSVHRGYLAAADTHVPIVFVIGREAKIEWIGLPRYMDAVVEAVVDGRWNHETFETVLDLRREAYRALRRGRIPEGLELLDRLIATDLERSDRHRLRKFIVLLKHVDDPEAAYAVAREMARDKWDDADALNEIAWLIVDEPGIGTRDLTFAMEIALRANELTEGKSPYVLDTVARVFWEQGELGTAIAWQHRAVQQAVGTPWERPLRRTLRRYERVAPAY